MSDRPQVPLGDLTLKIGSGATPRGGREVYQTTGVAFIRSQNVYDNRFSFDGLARITDEAAEALSGVAVEEGDVLIDITGESVTRTCQVPPDALPARVSQHVAIIRPNPARLDSGYLKAALLDPVAKRRLNQLSSAGATRRALTKAHLASFTIPLPLLEEQRRIAGVLGALDDLIDTNRRLAGQAESLATALVSTSVAEVPLAEFAAVADVRQFQPGGLVDHFSIPVFDEGRLPDRIEGDTIKSGKLLLTEPTVLVSRLNPQTPRVWMAYPSEVPAAASTEFVPLVADGSVAVEEVWAVCSTDEFGVQMRTRVTGTTGSHQRVDKAALPGLMVADVRRLARTKRTAIISLVQEAHASLVSAAEAGNCRDELLPLLLSGRVQVDEVAA